MHPRGGTGLHTTGNARMPRRSADFIARTAAHPGWDTRINREEPSRTRAGTRSSMTRTQPIHVKDAAFRFSGAPFPPKGCGP